MNKLFILILNNAIIAGWMILAIILFRFAFRKMPKWMNCLLWGMVAIRLLIPFSIESIFSLIPSSQTVPRDIEYVKVPQIDAGVSSINMTINPILANHFTASEIVSVNPIGIIIFLSAHIWLFGIICMLAYAFVSYLILAKRIAKARLLESGVKECDSVESPFILGFVRPCIYVPSSIEQEAYLCVLEHEKAHIKRGDHIWKPLGFLLLSIYWFHPLSWIAYICLCKDIEYACDEKVTREKDAQWKVEYCQVLLDLSTQRKMVSACPVAFGEVGVKERVKSVLNYKKPTFWILLVSIAVVVIVIVCFMTNPKQEDSAQGETASVQEYMHVQEEQEQVNQAQQELEQQIEAIENVKQDSKEFSVTKEQLFVEEWARAYCDKDGKKLYAYSTKDARKMLGIEKIGTDDEYTFEEFSAWPSNDKWFYIQQLNEQGAVIYYYAISSDPHVTVWRQHISFEKQTSADEDYIVKSARTDKYENIVLGSEYDMAYGDGLFCMDYVHNGLGDQLNKDALLSSSLAYKDLFEPDTAARKLLNLLPNDNKIPIEVVDGENENEKILHITFLEDNEMRIVKMIQPWGVAGIWIPSSEENYLETEYVGTPDEPRLVELENTKSDWFGEKLSELVSVGDKKELKTDMLLGHHWGETEEETKTVKTQQGELLGYKYDDDLMFDYNENGKMYGIYYFFRKESNDNLSEESYRDFVSKLAAQLGKKVEESNVGKLLVSDIYDGKITYEIIYNNEECFFEVVIQNDIIN